MSKLDELIAEMCPDGVQSKKISELCCISRGIVISKEDISIMWEIIQCIRRKPKIMVNWEKSILMLMMVNI